MTLIISDADFRREYGSFLRNVEFGTTPTDIRPGTCTICGAPVSIGYLRCWGCNNAVSQAIRDGGTLPIDNLAILTYAVEPYFEFELLRSDGTPYPAKNQSQGRQAYNVLRGYKADKATRADWLAAVKWTFWMLQRWGPDRLHPGASWKWAIAPSRRSGRQNEHPLHRAVALAVGESHPEVTLTRGSAEAPRGLDASAYIAAPTAKSAHVVIFEDTWASGGTVLSAAAALKQAGASQVSAMVLGRILNPGWPASAEFIKYGALNKPFSTEQSPWNRVQGQQAWSPSMP